MHDMSTEAILLNPIFQGGLDTSAAEEIRKKILSEGIEELVWFPLGKDSQADKMLQEQGYKHGLVGADHPDVLIFVAATHNDMSKFFKQCKNKVSISQKQPKKPKTIELVSDIDKRIAEIERMVNSPVAGTQLVRACGEDGIEWTLAVGGMHMPKEFFTADTIEDVVSLAESTIKARLESGKSPTHTEADKMSEAMEELKPRKSRRRP